MKMKQQRRSDHLNERPSKNHKDEKPDKRRPNPDDPYEEKGPPIKEMPIKSHPDRKEILD